MLQLNVHSAAVGRQRIGQSALRIGVSERRRKLAIGRTPARLEPPDLAKNPSRDEVIGEREHERLVIRGRRGELRILYVLDEVSGKSEAIEINELLVSGRIGVVRHSESFLDEPARAVLGERQRHRAGIIGP